MRYYKKMSLSQKRAISYAIAKRRRECQTDFLTATNRIDDYRNSKYVYMTNYIRINKLNAEYLDMKKVITLSHNQKLYLYEKLDLYDQNVDLSHTWKLSKGTGESDTVHPYELTADNNGVITTIDCIGQELAEKTNEVQEHETIKFMISCANGRNRDKIRTPYDLYELYTDWLIDHDSGSNVLNSIDLENVETIREHYQEIYDQIDHDGDEMELSAFECLALEIVGTGDIDTKDDIDEVIDLIFDKYHIQHNLTYQEVYDIVLDTINAYKEGIKKCVKIRK